MPVLVTKPAPDFTAAAVFPGKHIKQFTLSEWKGKYGILLFYPMDFSLLCPTEIIAFNQKIKEFHKRNCKVAAISTDSEYAHLAWCNLSPEKGGIGELSFPLISDKTKNITRQYGILHDHSVALRGLFLLDRDGIVRHELINDLSMGRSVEEALRILDALIHYETYGDVCPADWKPGMDGLKTPAEGMIDYMAKLYYETGL